MRVVVRETAAGQIAQKRVGPRSMRHHRAIPRRAIALLQFSGQQKPQVAARQRGNGLSLIGLGLRVGDDEVAVVRIPIQVRLELMHALIQAAAARPQCRAGSQCLPPELKPPRASR